MEARSLREDLLGIEGVEGADVDGDDASPSGLRIRIAEGADQHHVGREIRRVLSSHGLGTDTTLPGEGAVAVDAGSAHDDAMASMSDLAAEGSPEVATSDVATMTGSRRIIDLTEEEDEQVAPEFDAASTATLSPHASVVGIEKVGVEEGRSGIVISITTTDGRLQREVARPTEGGVDRAVILAATRLAAPDVPDPIIVDVDERRIEGVDIIMIVLDCNGRMSAGSAVIGAGRAFALARASWAAVAV